MVTFYDKDSLKSSTCSAYLESKIKNINCRNLKRNSILDYLIDCQSYIFTGPI